VEPEPDNPSGIPLPNDGLNSGIVPGKFVYKPIGQVTSVSTAAYEVFFRRGRIECGASEGDDHTPG
jgi:hypothetical protein